MILDGSNIAQENKDLKARIAELCEQLRLANIDACNEKARANDAEARVKDIKDAAAMVLFDIAEMSSTEGLNRLVILASLCECEPVDRDSVVDWQARENDAEKEIERLAAMVAELHKQKADGLYGADRVAQLIRTYEGIQARAEMAEARVCHLEEALRWIANIPNLTAANARSHALAALRGEGGKQG